MKVRTIIQRWANNEERSLRRLFHGKTIGDRFDGLRRSKKNEAKFFLLAIVPMVVIGPFIGKWSDASLFRKALLALPFIWFVAVLIGGGVFLFRALFRASRRHSK